MATVSPVRSELVVMTSPLPAGLAAEAVTDRSRPGATGSQGAGLIGGLLERRRALLQLFGAPADL